MTGVFAVLTVGVSFFCRLRNEQERFPLCGLSKKYICLHAKSFPCLGDDVCELFWDSITQHVIENNVSRYCLLITDINNQRK